MLYEDFSKEILRWQGIFDGYPENDSNYRLYFELISTDIKDLDALIFCLKKHHENKNRLFPKPFELIEYSKELKEIIFAELQKSPFYKEITKLKELIDIQKYCIVNKTDPQERLQAIEKMMIENEKKLKELEEKRASALKTKRIAQ